jgi:hypothetical protein
VAAPSPFKVTIRSPRGRSNLDTVGERAGDRTDILVHGQPAISGGGHQVFRAAGDGQDGANLRVDPEAKNLGQRALARRLFAVQGHGRDHAKDTHRNGGRPRLSDS